MISVSGDGAHCAEVSEPRPRAIDQASRRRIYVLLIAVIVLWGANWPIMKIGLGYVPPLAFGALRLAIGSACLFVLLAGTGRLRRPSLGDTRIVLSEAVLHMAAPLALMNIALLHVEAGRSSVLSYTTPIWTVPLSLLLLGDRLTSFQGLGVAIGVAGILVLFGPSALAWYDADVVIGNALLLLSALTWAAAILIARTQTWRLSPLQLAPWQMLLAALLLAIPALVYEPIAAIRWSPQLVAVLAFNGPIASAFCFWGALVVSKELPPVMSSVGFLGAPVAGVLFSSLSLGEPMTCALIGGLVLIVLGIGLVSFGAREPSAH